MACAYCFQVFECVMSWVNGDLSNREQYLAELVEYVRLPLLSQDYLIQRVEEEPLLKQDAQCKYTSTFCLHLSLDTFFSHLLNIVNIERKLTVKFHKIVFISGVYLLRGQ